MLGAGSGIIASCCSVDATSDVYGLIGKVNSATTLTDSYYTSAKGAVGVGNATITDCFKFSSEHWPTNNSKGWGDTPPMGWENGTWSNPWDFIGGTENPTKYPTLKRLR